MRSSMTRNNRAVGLLAVVLMAAACDETPPARAPSRRAYPPPYGARYAPYPQPQSMPPPAPYEQRLVTQVAPTTPAAAPPPLGAPQSARNPTLLFSFVGRGASAPYFAAAVQRGLADAGYPVVADSRFPHDADALLRITLAAAGPPNSARYGHTVVMTAILVIEARGAIVDQTSVRFETDGGTFPPDAVGRLVTPLNQSMRLRDFAQQTAAQNLPQPPHLEAADAQPQPKDEKQERQAREEEEAAWIAARVEGCRQPAALTSCDAVRMFLVRYPKGNHIDDGNSAVAQAAPKIAELQKDENTWQAAGSAACVPGGTKDVCVGVELYLHHYPAGLHAVDAQRLMDQARGRK
jgi:hypothetical protein